MRISVTVITRASRNAIEKIEEGIYKVWVTVVPQKGSANKAVIEILASEFATAKSNIELVSGHRTKRKVFEITK